MTKSTIVLLGILAALGLVAFLVLQKPGEQSVLPTEGEFFLALDSAAVEKIEIQSPTTSVVLAKRGTEWYVEHPLEYRADQSKVTSFIGKLKNLRIDAVVSSNPDKQSLFQVDSAGTIVRVTEYGADPLSFFVGKMGPSFSEVFLRKQESNDVVTADASVSYDARRSTNDWRDHTIINVPKETITEIAFRYGDTTFVVSLKDSVWMVGNAVGNSQTIQALLASLSTFQCDDFLDTPPSPSPKLVATVSFSGRQIRFSQMKGRDSYYVQTSDNPQWYEVRSWRAHQVLKRRHDLTK